MPNLILIGFMGCGKSTLGKKAAHALQYQFVDMDRYIEKQEGMEISRIFADKGEPYFRKRELQAALELGRLDHTVIATGGGVVKSPDVMEALKQNGTAVYLRATPEQIFRNTENDDKRPLLKGGDRMERIQTLLEERRADYERYADAAVDIGGPLKNTAARIIAAWEGTLCK